MCQGEAKQRKGRWFKCLAPAGENADALPGQRIKKASALVVLGAGSRNFNGVYLFEGDYTAPPNRNEGSWTDGDRYRKRNGTEALTYHSGWWLFTADTTGASCYGVQVDPATGSFAPPQRGWCIKHGKAPAPCTEEFSSLEEVPLQLREADADESYALEVCGAGSVEFDGVYRPCGLRQGKFCYRKEDGDQTLIYHKGWWVMNENGCGESAYGLRCDKARAMPPSGAAWGFKNAKAPAPSVTQVVPPVVPEFALQTRAASPATTSLDSALHLPNAGTSAEVADPQSHNMDGSWASMSASGTLINEDGHVATASAIGPVNRKDGSWASGSSSGTANCEAGSPHARSLEESVVSVFYKADGSLASSSASRVVDGFVSSTPASRTANCEEASPHAQSLGESVVPLVCNADDSLASTSASRAVDDSLPSTSASKTVDGSLSSTPASGTANCEAASPHAQSLEESVVPLIRKADDSLASSSASRVVDGSLPSTSASKTVDGSLSSTPARGTANCEAASPHAQSLQESVVPLVCKANDSLSSSSASRVVDGSLPSTSASKTVDGSLSSTSASGTANCEAASPHAQSLGESIVPLVCEADDSFASTSASRVVDCSLPSISASKTVDGSLSSTSASGTVNHDVDLDVEQAIISTADGRDLAASDDATAEHQAAEASVLPASLRRPRAGHLVSQRLNEFAKLREGMSARSKASHQMPDLETQQGLVSQRSAAFRN